MKRYNRIFSKILIGIFVLTVIFMQNISVFAAGAWNYVGDLSAIRNYFGVAELNGKIYVAGGESDGKYSNKFEEYDPKTNTWATKANLPTAREMLGLASLNGKLYAIGGSGGPISNSYRVDEYDPLTDKWVAKRNMSTDRYGFAITVANGKIYVMGGYSSSVKTNTVIAYDPVYDTWQYKASMPTARSSCNAATINGKIYVVGGSGNSALKTLEVYDPSSDTWAKAADMLTPRYSFSVAAYNGRIFAMGGFGLNSTEEYNPLTNTWTVKENMLSARYNFGSAVADGKIYAIGGSDLKTVEAYFQQVVPPVVPTNVTASSTINEITVVWNAASDANTYSIELDGSSVVNNIKSASYTVTGLAPGTQHTYRVKTVNAGGESQWSAPVSISTQVLPPAVPTNVTASSTQNEITVVWNAVSGADSYSIELDGSSIVNNIASASYTVTGLVPATQHTYRVKAVNAGGESQWSAPISISTQVLPPAVPTNVTASSTINEITVAWNAVSGADSYSIELDGSSVVNNITSASYTVTGLVPATQHTYRVKAVNAGGESQWSAPVSISTQLLPPAVPTNVTASSTINEITVVWNAVSRADSYSIELDGSSVVNNIASVSYTVTGLAPGTQHTYRVKAVNAGGESQWSAPVSISTQLLLATPSGIHISTTRTAVSCYWDAVSGATGYIIEFDGRQFNNMNYTNFSISPNPLKSSYTLRIKAVNSVTESEWSELITITMPQ